MTSGRRLARVQHRQVQVKYCEELDVYVFGEVWFDLVQVGLPP